MYLLAATDKILKNDKITAGDAVFYIIIASLILGLILGFYLQKKFGWGVLEWCLYSILIVFALFSLFWGLFFWVISPFWL